MSLRPSLCFLRVSRVELPLPGIKSSRRSIVGSPRNPLTQRLAPPQVYSIPLGGTMVETKFAIGGSGSAYITGLVDATFREGMTEDECRAWVQRSVTHAMSRDASSGGCVRTVAISAHGVRRDFLEGDKLPL